MACGSCGAKRRHQDNNTNKELEYLRKFRFLTPKQLKRRRELEEMERRKQEGDK